jgi:hypothetical protein
MFLSSLILRNTSSFLTRSAQPISSLLQHHISYLHSAVLKFQNHTKLCSKCSISLVSCFSQICRQKVFCFWNNRPIQGFSSFPFVQGALNFLWKRVTPVIAGWFPGRMRTHNSIWYIQPLELLCNFYSLCIIYICGRGPHNTRWRAADWKPMS